MNFKYTLLHIKKILFNISQKILDNNIDTETNIAMFQIYEIYVSTLI
jgi:hypothetical protein